MDIEENLDNWRMWCRLCAKADPKRNMSVFFKDEQEEQFYRCADGENKDALEQSKSSFATKDTTLPLSIEKHFCVHMVDNEDLPKVLCVDCFSLMRELSNFSERVAKVQKMFGTLQKAASSDMDLHAVRLQVDILDGDSEHLSMIKQSLPEMHFFKPNSQITELKEQLLDMETCNINPIELQEMEIKRESTYNATADSIPNSDNDEDYDIGVDDDDDDDEEFLSTKDKSENAYISSDENSDIEMSAGEKRTISTKNDSDGDDGESGEKLLLTCTECPRKFKGVKSYRHHLNIEHSKEPEITALSCSQCSRTFTKQCMLKRHRSTHLPSEKRRIIPCPYCEKKFINNTHLKQHVKKTHLNVRGFICDECGAALCTNELLQTHLLIHTGDDDGESGEKLLTCTECPLKFKRIKRYRHHLKIVHAKGPDFTGFSCSECLITFTNPYTLKRHIATHLPLETRRILHCPYCEKKYTLNSHLKQHVKNTHLNERDFICEECGAALCTNESLQRHLLMHTGKKPFKCKICPRAFTDKRNLNSHMEIHDSSKHACPECGKQLNTLRTLKEHLIRHVGERSIQCELCEYKSYKMSEMIIHRRSHTGERPFPCNYCDKPFATKTKLKRHRRIHEKVSP